MVRAGLSVRTFGPAAGRAFAPDFRSATARATAWFFDPARPLAYFVVKVRRGGVGSAGLSAQNDRGFKPKLRCGATETPAPRRRLCAARRPPDERSCGRDGPVTYRSSPERVCRPRVVPKKIEMVKRRRTHERLQVEDVMPVGRVRRKA